MVRFFHVKDLKEINRRYTSSYFRYLNFYLVVTVIALFLYSIESVLESCRKWAGLRSWVLSFFFSYCSLKYVFSIIRQVDKYFDTDFTDIIEDNTMFYEGSFMADLRKLVYLTFVMHSMLNTIATLLLPHFRSIMNLSFPELINGILEASRRQGDYSAVLQL